MRKPLIIVFGFMLFLYRCKNACCSEEKNNSICPWNCTCLGNTVDCSQKGFYALPDNLPTWAEVLDLSTNNIETINVLDKFQHLKELNLNGNPLVQEYSNYCGTSNNLCALRLSNVSVNGLMISNKLNLSCNVSQLHLSHNQMRDIDRSFLTSFPKLSLLDLSFNNFSILDNSTFPVMIHLRDLILDDNLVNLINKEFFDSIPNLEILKLNRNRIQFLRKNLFVGLKHLKTLELESNKLTTVEGLTFKGLGSLVCLSLKKNFISQLMDGSFWGLTRIQALDLSGNNISSIDNKWLYGLESLKQLLMAHNKIEIIHEEAWKFSKNITELNLRHNKLTSLSESTFAELNFLRRLQLQHNNISHIDDSAFHHMTFLKTMDLGFNNLSWTLDGSGMQFDHLFSLTRLVLEYNDIRFVSKRLFRDLPSLKHLNIAGANLAYVQARAFENIQDLKYFYMDSKNLLCDCQLAWLLEWLLKNKFEVHASCSYPESLADRQLMELRKEELKCFSFSKPVITQEPYSVNAVLHGNMTLTCVAASAGKSSLTIDWRKDNVALDNEQVEEVRAKPAPSPQSSSITQVVSQIVLNPVVDDHTGVYQCIASNVIGSTYSVKAHVTVNVFPTFSKTPESSIMVRIGTTARFDCSAVGLPPPVITLQKDGGDDFPAARERRMHIYPSDERFFIVNIKPEDQGIYTCSATNPVGVISFNTTLQVLEPPKFVRRMGANKSVIEGETTVLECQAHGSPHPKVEWLKDSKPVVLTLRHFSTSESQFLIIVQTDKNDEGEYSCIISNTLGSEKQTVYLSVVLPTLDGNMVAKTSLWDNKDDHGTTTAGFIVIAVVCCIVVTSLAWACIIYSRTRRPYVRCSFLDHQTHEAIQKNNKWKDNFNRQPNVTNVYMADRQCCVPTNRNISENLVIKCDGCEENNKSCQNHNDSGTHTIGSVSSLSKSESNTSEYRSASLVQHPIVDFLEKKLHASHSSPLHDQSFDKNPCRRLEESQLVESSTDDRRRSLSLTTMPETDGGFVPTT